MRPEMESIVSLRRRRIRWFFAGILVVSAMLDVLGALLTQHQARSQFLETLLPVDVSLGGRTGVVMLALALVLLAAGIVRGKRIAWQLTCVVLLVSVAFHLVKDLDFENAALATWIVLGLWWFREDFRAASNPASVRRGLAILGGGLILALTYAIVGALVLEGQMAPRFGVARSLEHVITSMAASPAGYTALTSRADWFLQSLPFVAYGLVILGLTQLLRPALALRVARADQERLRSLLAVWSRNPISHLALHGEISYHWSNTGACVPFRLMGRVALVLGDPIAPPSELNHCVQDFIAHCDRQDWIPAFYQVDDGGPHRELGLGLVPIGREAVVSTRAFSLEGKERHDLRYSLRRCARAGITITFENGPAAWAALSDELKRVSGQWLRSRGGPELGFSLGTLATLHDPTVTLGIARAESGRVEAFVSWLPVAGRKGWTLDLMRRRPDAAYGVMEALIARSIDHACSCGIELLSLGLVPIEIQGRRETEVRAMNMMRLVYWGLDRFQRGDTLRRFKTKFGPRWETRYLAMPNSTVLPEVLLALARVHLPRALRRRQMLESWSDEAAARRQAQIAS